jgi:mannose-6-phosphate isomerase-like protein (cupin superfamily)
MDPVERELRKKLRGLRTSQSRSMLALQHPGTQDKAKKYRAKVAEVKRAIKEVEDQIESYQQQKKRTVPPFSVKKPGEGRIIAVVGDVYRFLATGKDTNDKYALWEAIVPPGGGPPPHVHSREEEGFYILEGEITISVGEERIVATAGMFANMPVGTPHSFKNESGKPARILISIAPAGLEQMLFEFGVPVAQGATTAPPPTKAEIDKLLEIAPRYGIEIRLPEH